MGRKQVAMAPEPAIGMTLPEVFSASQFQYWFAALVIIHLTLWLLFSFVPAFQLFKPRAAFAAHAIVFMVPFCYLAYEGLTLWFFDDALADPSFDRQWGRHAGAERIVLTMIATQLYDIPSSLALPEHRQPEFIAHHVIVFSLAVIALRFRYALYFGVYFLGVIELSTPLLACVDFFRDFPSLAKPGTVGGIFNEIVRVGFAVAFFTVRIIFWVPASIDFWRKAILPFLAAEPSARREVPIGCIYFWAVSHLGITALQWFWGSKIVRAAVAMAQGDDSQRANEAKNA